MGNSTQEAISAFENDLVLLSRRLLNSPNHLRANSVIKLVRQIASEQKSLLDYVASDQAYSQKLLLLKDLHERVDTLLTENNHCSTWFTKCVDRYCHDDPHLKQRLNDFFQQMIGPVIKLSEFIKDKNKSLAIEFPNEEMRDIFLKQSGVNKIDSIVIDKNIVYFPAFLSETQQLGVTFPTIKLKEDFIRLLNLEKANLIASSSDDCNLYINDRRIHDIASRFYIAVICPYFTEYYKIQHASHLLAKARLDRNCFFSVTKFPTELTVKIASEVSSSDTISSDEKMQIAFCNFQP